MMCSFQDCTVLADKAGAYQSEAPFRCSNLGQAPGSTRKHKTKLERLARDKHSSLLRKFVNYGNKKFYNIDPWPEAKPSLEVKQALMKYLVRALNTTITLIICLL